MTAKKRVVLILFSTLLFLSLGCTIGSLLGAGEEPAATPPGTAVVVETSQPLATQPPLTVQSTATRPAATTVATLRPAGTLPPQPTTGAASQTFNLDSQLDQAQSYRLTLAIDVNGKDSNNKAVIQNMKMGQELVKPKSQSHLSMSGFDLGITSGTFDMYQVGAQSYILLGAQGNTPASCMSFGSDSGTFDTSALIKPEDIARDIQIQSLVAAGEMVNGVKADHYKVKKAILEFGTFTEETGDVWIAQPGGYVVKLVTTGKGTFDVGSGKVIGTMTVTYNLMDVNKLSEIRLPLECAGQGGLSDDVPLPPNATKVANLGNLVTFQSVDNPATVAAFFKQNLAAKGWKITNESSLGSGASAVQMISATKGDDKLEIMLSPGDGGKGTSALLTLSK